MCAGVWGEPALTHATASTQLLPSSSSRRGPSLGFGNAVPAARLWPAWHSYRLCSNPPVYEFIILIWSPDHLQTTYGAWQLARLGKHRLMMLLCSNYIKSLLKRQIQTTLEMFKESHRFLLDMHHYAAEEHSAEHKDIYYSADYALLQLKLV